MFKLLRYLIYLSSFLGLFALPSRSETNHGETLVPINLNSSAHTNWIILQATGKASDRQMVFAQMEQVRPIIPNPIFAPSDRRLPPIPQPQSTKPNLWNVRLITVNESIHKPGYTLSGYSLYFLK